MRIRFERMPCGEYGIHDPIIGASVRVDGMAQRETGRRPRLYGTTSVHCGASVNPSYAARIVVNRVVPAKYKPKGNNYWTREQFIA